MKQADLETAILYMVVKHILLHVFNNHVENSSSRSVLYIHIYIYIYIYIYTERERERERECWLLA